MTTPIYRLDNVKVRYGDRLALDVEHLEIDPGVMRCERCHDAHASDDPKLFKANAHGPFGAGSCTDCHLAPRSAKP